MQDSNLGYQKWGIAIYLMTVGLKGTSSMRIHRDLKITQASAWFMMQRIRQAFVDAGNSLPGPVEVDETYMGGKDANKHADRKPVHGNTCGAKQPVVGMKSRTTNQVKAQVVQTVSAKTLQRFVQTSTPQGGTVYSDQHRDSEKMGYPTQKPLALLERIISVSSKEGDLVLDPFCGCGTTLHAAEGLDRQWIGIDISAFSVGLVRERIVTNFPEKDLRIETHGTPYDVASAKALAKKDPFEFEKWVCGAIGAHGMFHDPGTKGRDGGVDGVIEFGLYQFEAGPLQKEYAIVQIKGGKGSPDHVKALSQTVEDCEGRAGIFVCFKEHLLTVEQNRKKGTYADLTGKYPIIQGFSVEQLLKGERPNLPPLIFRKDANLKQKKLGPLFDT